MQKIVYISDIVNYHGIFDILSKGCMVMVMFLGGFMSKKIFAIHSFGSIGDLFGRQIGAFVARGKTREHYDTIEEVAREVGADLADPEDFRIVQELVDQTSK